MSDLVTVRVNGQSVAVRRGTVAAAAVALAGVDSFRISVEGQPRGPLCGMGVCFECRLTINGRARQRSCLRPCVDGMELCTDD